MNNGALGGTLHVEGWEGFDRALDFDKKQVRAGMRRAGRIVVKDAQGRISGSPGSGAGDYPGMRTGRMYRAIRAKVSRSGFMVKIMPNMPAGAKGYYPGYLYYGVRRQAARTRGHRRQASGPYRIAPRKNFMADALDARQSEVRDVLGEALRKAFRYAS